VAVASGQTSPHPNRDTHPEPDTERAEVAVAPASAQMAPVEDVEVATSQTAPAADMQPAKRRRRKVVVPKATAAGAAGEVLQQGTGYRVQGTGEVLQQGTGYMVQGTGEVLQQVPEEVP